MNVTDITKQIHTYQQHNRANASANPISMRELQQIAAAVLTDPRGIGGLTFSIGNTAVPAKQLPQFLASLEVKK